MGNTPNKLYFDLLPNEILCKIGRNLNTVDAYNFARACSKNYKELFKYMQSHKKIWIIPHPTNEHKFHFQINDRGAVYEECNPKAKKLYTLWDNKCTQHDSIRIDQLLGEHVYKKYRSIHHSRICFFEIYRQLSCSDTKAIATAFKQHYHGMWETLGFIKSYGYTIDKPLQREKI